ncbi:MAG TPA: Rrf2 family transcriptional regulator [Atribacteraceae bacterium]|nr:Rrf2 family transcriptional regulator [Atribacteraceae bacterium]
MKLSTKTRYGLRFMMYLIKRHGNEPVQLAEVSRNEEISLKYLGQIASQLRVAGLIRSTRGAGGGYQLARDPGAITLKDLVETLEGGIFLVDCLDGKPCTRSTQCLAREAWEDVSKMMAEVLQSFSLRDIVSLYGFKKTAVDYNI